MEMSCETCKYFESRTKFCRKNPPNSIVIEENGKKFMTSSFPKIQMPQLDFCAEYKNIDNI